MRVFYCMGLLIQFSNKCLKDLDYDEVWCFGLLSNYVVDYICGWQSINLFFLIWCIDKVLVD